MKVTKTYSNGYTFEAEGEKFTDIFEQFAAFEEVLGPNSTTCRAKMNGEVYESGNVILRVRQDKEENKYYELVCMDNDVAGGKLKWYKKRLGVLKRGSLNLFPKRDIPENCYPGYDGWHKFDKDKNNNNEGNKEKATTKGKGKSDQDEDSGVPF